MGFKALSTTRSGATSTVSRQATVVNTNQGFAVSGSAIKSNTTISTEVITPGQGSNVTPVSGGVAITSVNYLNANGSISTANAVSTSGGNIKINGTGFTDPMTVIVGTTTISNANVTVANSTAIIASLGSASPGNVSVYAFTSGNAGAVLNNGVFYSGAPSWTTSSVSFQNGSSSNVALVASSDSTLTYTLQDGSTLPTGISLVSTGYLSGTATGYTTNSTGTVVIVATDNEGQAAQQTITWTVTVADPQFNYTTLLLNGETSVTPFINDASTNSLPLAIAGGAKADTFSPFYGNGYYSGSFNGSTDYLTVGSTLLPATGDFTVEFWVYSNTNAGSTQRAVYSQFASAQAGRFMFGIDQTSSTRAWLHYDGADYYSTANTLLPTIWYHYALTRSGDVFTIYLNGTQVYTNTFANASLYQSNPQISGSGGSFIPNAYVSNLRIITGQVLYTGAFTPPTSPLTTSSVGTSGANVAASITGTVKILTCQSNRFIDTSANAYTLTPAGTPKVSTAVPFTASSSYATYGSGYFDGAGDYLSTPDNSAFTLASNNFTFECWVYPTTITSGNNNILAQWVGGGLAFIFRYVAAGRPQFSSGATNVTGTSTAVVANQWNHVAITRTSGTIRLFVNGVQDSTTGTVSSCADSTANVTIAAYSDGTSEYVTGYISNLRLINGTSLYTSNFTPSTTPLTAVANTSLLTLQYNGGANNSGIIDNGPFDIVVTRAGNTSQGTFSPYSQTGWSYYFDGTGDYLTVPDNTALESFTDFTIEFWVYYNSVAGTQILIDKGWNGSTFSPYLIFSSSGALVAYASSGGGSWDVLSGAAFGTLAINTWYHIALTRSGSAIKLFRDGAVISTGTNSTTLMNSASALGIGGGPSAGASPFNGYISNLRIVKGTAVYTSAFTPSTTPLTAISGTSLLTCQSNRFIDNSTNNFTITKNGNTSVQAFSPFAPANSYAPATNGGSAYFDGTGDYLTVPNSATISGTMAYTIEFWIYRTSAPASTRLLENGTGTTSFSIDLAIAGTLTVNNNTTIAGSTSTIAVPFNAWTHVALVRTSTGTNGTAWYINGAAAGTFTHAVNIGGTTMQIARSAASSSNNLYGYLSDLRFIQNSAYYTTAFTPPTTPLTTVSGTSLLLNFTNGGMVDAHATNVLESVGNAQLSTAVKKFGNASMYFDGSSQYLTSPYNALYALESCDFTIEAWVYRNVIGAEHNVAVTRSGGGSDGWNLRINSSNTLQFYYTGGSSVTSTGTIPATTWTHVAVTRSGTTVRLFINGTIDGSATFSNGTPNTQALRVGVDNSNAAGFFNGYMDDLRITQGFARYTANFTPPTTAFLGQ